MATPRETTKPSSLAAAAAKEASPEFLESLGKNGSGGGLSLAERFEETKRRVDSTLPQSSKDAPRIAIIGSVDFYHSDSPDLCDAIGRALAKRFPDACIMTGANAIVHQRVSRAFYDELMGQTLTPKIFHLAPEGFVCDWNFGTILEAGRDMEERRRILATLPDICISVEGGPATADEMRLAVKAGHLVIPLGRTGGASGGMFESPAIACPNYVGEATWALLHDDKARVDATARAVASIVAAAQEAQAAKRATEAMTKVIMNAMDVAYTERPRLPDDCPAYVEPMLAGSAHLVFQGKEHASDDRTSCPGNVFLGPKEAVKPCGKNGLAQEGIGGIVNCTNNFPCFFQGTIKYCTVAVNDETHADILAFLDGATAFIHSLINEGVNVLVHCERGISRSATVVIAYLIRFWNMTRDEAYLHVKARRPMINPNPGFWDQLQEFEDRCRGRTEDNAGEAPETAKSGAFDGVWAKHSNALFATCRATPDTLKGNELIERLKKVETQEKHEEVLTTCLDYVWGRGVIEIDLDWLKFVCTTLDDKEAPPEKEQRASATVEKILRDNDSAFWGIWAGEVYEDQIQKVLKKVVVHT